MWFPVQEGPSIAWSAARVSREKTKKATVTEALREYIARREQATIVELFGKVDVDPSYDYEEHRRRR